MADALQLHHRVSQFLFHEARLLDERRWDEWNALFTTDGDYWAPATPEQPEPENHVSLIYENDLLRKVRIARFASPNAPSLQPFPRTVHLLSNVMVDAHDSASGEVIATSRFLMIEYRRDKQRFYAGAYRHELASETDGYRIRQKRVDLVNCDGAHESSAIWF
ncbi:MAG: aromatic-ring-hydroxylating dioxygenase subunit beta [Parvularculaceae bacterium]